MKIVIAFAFTTLIALSACMETSTASTAASTLRIPSDAERVTLAVGETKRIDAIRASDCAGPAPTWAEVQPTLPPSQIVTYSDGGISSRNSGSCRRNVATRAINGTGVATGTEVHEYNDTVAITVQ